MNIYIIIPALLIAIAGIAGIAFFASAYAGAVSAFEFMKRHVAQMDEVMGTISQCEHDALAEIDRLREQLPSYGRDPKTGQFTKVRA